MKTSKKFRTLFLSVLALCGTALLASCSDLTDATVSSSDEDLTSLNVEITNYDSVISRVSEVSSSRALAQSNARTIIPDSFDSTGVKFYLVGDSNGKTANFGPEEVSFTGKDGSNTVGTIQIPASTHDWEFRLYAIDSTDTTFTFTSGTTTEADVKSAAVLMANASMDMTNYGTATFTLSPDGLTKSAAIAMKVYLDDWDLPTGFTTTVGIYLLPTNADATSTGDGTGTETEQEITSIEKTEPTDANYSVATMTPGTYLFKVTFSNATTGKKFIWSDIILVLPGKTVDNAVAIPNIIGVVPTAPTSFKAGYVKDTEDKNIDLYVTEFEWVRGSKNEQYFEIDLLELSSTDTTITAVPTETTWASDGTSTTYGRDFSSSDVYSDGSLLACNTSAKFLLELGKRYYARIRAINDAGESAYTYVTVDSDTTNGAIAFNDGTTNKSSTINRYRVTYYLNGGTYDSDGNGAVDSGSTENVVNYFCQSATDGNDVLHPTGDGTTTAASLIYTTSDSASYPWSYWKNDSGDKLDSTDTDCVINSYLYKGYENLNLYATYTTPATVQILDKKAYEIKTSWITGTLDDSTSVTITGGITNGGTATIDASSATKVTWKFTPADVKYPDGTDFTDFAFDSVTVTASKGGAIYNSITKKNVGSTGAEFEMDLADFSNSVYNIQFSARYGTTNVSYPLTLTIER